ncbi:MAG TPA: hypothetical protein VI306_01320 [Pyrinomonadaceae bacterium]
MSTRSSYLLKTVVLTVALVFSINAKEANRSAAPVPANNNGVAWNLIDKDEPLLSVPDNIRANQDLSLTFPFGQFALPLTQALHYNAQAHKYLLMLTSNNGRQGNFFELKQVGATRTYSTLRAPRVELFDQGSIKVLQGSNGSLYNFMMTNEGELRCIQIQDRTGGSIRLSYNADGLINGLSDSAGRTISVVYNNDQVTTVVQTWNVLAVKMVKSWNTGATHEFTNHENSFEKAPRFGLTKSVPTNAVKPNYTAQMADCDRLLARIFGGPNAIAAANSFEPAGLSGQYPIYRGDLVGADGLMHPGHLSYAMHLYGSEDGTGNSPLYVPAGFTSHTNTPTPTDAAITFYYPRLGNLTNVTLAVFHVADFEIREENGRIRIGNIGGRGGSFELYKHSHIEFYHGNTGLPASNQRQALRINPAEVFGVGYDSVRMRTVAQR